MRDQQGEAIWPKAAQSRCMGRKESSPPLTTQGASVTGQLTEIRIRGKVFKECLYL